MPVGSQRVRSDYDVLNAVDVELGQQISEVLVHRCRYGSIAGTAVSAPTRRPLVPRVSCWTSRRLAPRRRREKRERRSCGGSQTTPVTTTTNLSGEPWVCAAIAGESRADSLARVVGSSIPRVGTSALEEHEPAGDMLSPALWAGLAWQGFAELHQTKCLTP
jgi:hypothetical protein